MPPGNPRTPFWARRASLARAAPVALLALSYFALGAGSLSALATLSPYVASLWLPTGLAIAAMFLWGARCWPGIVAGAAAVNVYAGSGALASTGIALGNTLEALAVFRLLTAAPGFRPTLERLADVARFMAATVAACGANALWGNAMLAASGVGTGVGLSSIVHWWIGDVAGALVFAPFILANARRDTGARRGRMVEAGWLLAASGTAAALLFFGIPGSTLSEFGRFPFLLLPFVLWGALRFGLPATSAMTLLVTSIAAVATAYGSGPFDARALGPHAMLLLGMFAAVLAVTGLLASAVDAHRRRELGLRRERAVLHQILDGLPVGVWTADRDGTVQSSNPAGIAIWGGLRKVGIPDYGVYRMWRRGAGTPLPVHEFPLTRAVRLREKVVDEMVEIESFDGQRKAVVASAWPLFDDSGQVGAVAVHQDLSALHEADKSVRELFAVVEQTQDIVFVTGRDGTIEYVNPAFERLTGYTREEAVGRQPSLLKSAQHDAAFYGDMWQTLLAGKAYSGVVANCKKGGELYYESKTISPLRDKAGVITHFVSTGKDITGPIRAEAALRTQAVHQRTVAAFGQRALAGGDVREMMGEAVEALCSALGVRHGEALMLTPDRQALALKACMGCDPALTEQVIPVIADCSATRALHGSAPVAIDDYGAEAGIAEPAFVPRGTLRSSINVPIPGPDGVVGVLCAHSEQRCRFDAEELDFAQAMANVLGALIQRKDAEEQLRQLNAALEARIDERTRELANANRELEAANEELNAFAYSVSHDLRGTLRRVQGFSNLVVDANRDKLDENSVRQLQRIQSNAEHMGTLVDDLLHLSRIARHKLACSHFDLTAMALSIAGGLRELYPPPETTVDIERGLRAFGDQHLLRLALGNLLDNAWKYTRRTDAPRIQVGRKDAEVPTFYVKDNGAGFDARYAEKLFKPFERLHGEDEFEGTGIGLSIVQRAVAKHGGRAWAESREGDGACFYFTLPEVGKT